MNQVVFLLLFGLSLGNLVLASDQSHATNCSNSNEDQLKEALKKFYSLNINEIINGVEYFPPIKSRYMGSILNIETPAGKSEVSYGDPKCSRTQQTIWEKSDQGVAICPHHFVQVDRPDRYPFKRIVAVCNCENCLGFNSNNSKCMPVYLARPVLKRGECKPNGQFRWSAMLENVPISCVCADNSIAN